MLGSGYFPELGKFYRGKVRDNHVSNGRRVLVATDRVSAYDRILDALVPEKGAVLNAIAMWWFEQMEEIVPHHVIDWPDPNVLVARETRAIPVEMVVRGYLSGSAWRDVESGEFAAHYGVSVSPDDVEGGQLLRNCKLKQPIVTPTAKARTGHDEPLTPEGAREMSGELYDEMVETALRLYRRGAELAQERGLILVDTKYEFGVLDGTLILIDEIHTPDSSRYWLSDRYAPGRAMEELSKQFVRDIVADAELSRADVEETRHRYTALYERLTGRTWEPRREDRGAIQQRIVNNLVRQGYIVGGYVHIVAGSSEDDWHVEKLVSELEALGIPLGHEVASAHKSTRELVDLVQRLNQSVEPVVLITVAGGSDALSGVAAHQARFPVIACPPYDDELSYLINVHSTVQVPSEVPVLFCKRPANAVLAAERILASLNPLFETRNRPCG